MNKVISVFLVGVVLIATVMTGCSGLSFASKEECKNVALEFFKSLNDKDYEKSFDLLAKPKGSYFTQEGFEWQLLRTKYSDISDTYKGSDVIIDNESYNSDRAVITVHTGSSTNSYNIYMRLIDGKWGIDPEGDGESDDYSFCCTNWRVILPSNVKTKINGIELSDEFIVPKSDSLSAEKYNLMTDYIIPFIDRKPVTFEFESKNFTSKVEKVKPVSNSGVVDFDSVRSMYVFARVDAEDDNSRYFEFIQNMYNDVMRKFADGEDAESIGDWVDSMTTADEIWETLPHMRLSGSLVFEEGTTGKYKPVVQMTKCIASKDNSPYWISDNILVVPCSCGLQLPSKAIVMKNNEVVLKCDGDVIKFYSGGYSLYK